MIGLQPHHLDHKKLYEEYYLNQRGRGMATFTGARYQRGHGLGNILRSLTKFALPFLKKGAKAVGKQAMKTGMNIAQEAMLGQNIKKAAKRHLSQGLTELVTQHGRYQPRKQRRGPPGERVKKRKVAISKRMIREKPKRGYKRKVNSHTRITSHSAKRRRTSKRDIFG